MGYMDISIGGSDMASDFHYVVVRAALAENNLKVNELFKSEIVAINNEYNTCGAINVALVLTERHEYMDENLDPSGYYVKDHLPNIIENYSELVEETKDRIVKIKSLWESSEWDNKESQKSHVDSASDLLKNLDKLT
jgi:hypothetical protein